MKERKDGGAPSTDDETGWLFELIHARRSDILRAWEESARESLPTAERLDEPALRDNVPQILDWIGDVVRATEDSAKRTPGALPEVHAHARIREGYDLIEVARELGLLRRVILEMWASSRGPTIATDEVIRLNEAIDLLIARSVMAFATAQQRQVRERLDTEQQMIGIVAHDLRGPLQTITVSADTLLRLSLDARATRPLSRIRDAALGAGRMIRDLLDFTQARLGTGIPVDRVAVNLHAIARAALEEERARAADRELIHEEKGDARAELDPERVAQVVQNLVRNALEYGQPGAAITVRTEGAGDSVVLRVHNHGAPIALDLRAHLFEPLRRGNRGRRGSGVGLGLYIVDSIVRAHGGAVTVTSSERDGTEFTARFPRAAERREDDDELTGRS